MTALGVFVLVMDVVLIIGAGLLAWGLGKDNGTNGDEDDWPPHGTGWG